MKNIFLLIYGLITTVCVKGQYPFDKYEKLNYKFYNDWKSYDMYDKKEKTHETITVPHFYNDSISLTIQFTYDKPKTENIIRIYKGKETIQRFKKEPVDFYLYYVNSHPIRVADINGDGLLDLKIIYDYHTNGLSLSYRPIYLIQNKDETFTKISFDNMYEDRLDFERDFNNDKNFEILSVSLVGQDNHNYWSFGIFNFENGEFVDNSLKYGYPIFIQFLNKRNYKQTDRKINLEENQSISNLVIDTGEKIK